MAARKPETAGLPRDPCSAARGSGGGGGGAHPRSRVRGGDRAVGILTRASLRRHRRRLPPLSLALPFCPSHSGALSLALSSWLALALYPVLGMLLHFFTDGVAGVLMAFAFARLVQYAMLNQVWFGRLRLRRFAARTPPANQPPSDVDPPPARTRVLRSEMRPPPLGRRSLTATGVQAHTPPPPRACAPGSIPEKQHSGVWTARFGPAAARGAISITTRAPSTCTLPTPLPAARGSSARRHGN